jgi:hypothetical protein
VPEPTAEALARFLVNNAASIRDRPLEVARTMLGWFARPISELHVAALDLDLRNMALQADAPSSSSTEGAQDV